MKKILFSIIGLVAVVLLIAAVMPKNFKIEKEITINKPRSEVFSYLKDIKNDVNWNPWMKKDANMKVEYKGKEGEVGFVQSWSSENKEVGVGEAEIVGITDDSKIDMVLRFKEPMQAINQASFTTESVGGGDQTRVIWTMTGRTNFPFNLVCFFMQKQVNQEFINGLNNLKEIVEKK